MNATRTSANIGPIRSQEAAAIEASFWLEMAEASAKPRPQPKTTARSDWHYKSDPYSKAGHYDGPLAHLPEDQVRALLQEALRYFSITSDLPSPPHGLPGTTGEYYLSAKSVADEGARYLLALIEGRTRTVWSAHDEILGALNKQYHKGRDDEAVAQNKKWAEESAERWADAEPRPEATVYFIGSDPGPIKIGIATCVKKRLAALQTSNPHRLQVLATCPGGREQEATYHNLFCEHRLAGEWFNPHADILAEIARLSITREPQEG